MDYAAEIESQVAGIPCIIGVISFDGASGSYDRNAASDLDYYGWTESEWEVLDRRGRKAPWLERKLSEKDCDRIEREVTSHFCKLNTKNKY